ncbi:MAG: (2Fe-2S)-binding protein [Planctomycetota bacterium]|jgi:aerobic-type carbon monoxide dehydrogenase small subunit (CoxS/CutS family)
MAERKVRVSRRDVLRGAGAAALVGAVSGVEGKEPPGPAGLRRVGPGPVRFEFTLNGEKRALEVEPRVTLLDALRNRIGLTGTKRICDHGACGGCTIWVDGKTVNACMMLAVDAAGTSVTTIEGLARDGKLHPVQAAFVRHDALQCGFCTPGMIMSCAALVGAKPSPTDEEIRHALAGNLCRCGTYPHVLNAVKEVAR